MGDKGRKASAVSGGGGARVRMGRAPGLHRRVGEHLHMHLTSCSGGRWPSRGVWRGVHLLHNVVSPLTWRSRCKYHRSALHSEPTEQTMAHAMALLRPYSRDSTKRSCARAASAVRHLPLRRKENIHLEAPIQHRRIGAPSASHSLGQQSRK